MEYKKKYTSEELEALVKWFKEHMEQLPESLQLDKATYIKDLKYTVSLYFDIVKDLQDIPCYAAQIRHLFLMKEAVEREWKQTDAVREVND